MKLNEVRFKQRFATGDYEFIEVDIVVTPEGKEQLPDVLLKIEEQVNAFYSKEETKPAAMPAATKGKKNGTKQTDTTDDEDAHDDSDNESDEGASSESTEDDEATDSEDSNDTDSDADDSEDDNSGDEDEKSVKSAKAALIKSLKKDEASRAKAKAKFKKKPQSYSRASEQHKEIFSGVLKSVAPNWKKSEASKLKAKQVSQKMEGKEFLDETGDVLSSFTAEVKKLMK